MVRVSAFSIAEVRTIGRSLWCGRSERSSKTANTAKKVEKLNLGEADEPWQQHTEVNLAGRNVDFDQSGEGGRLPQGHGDVTPPPSMRYGMTQFLQIRPLRRRDNVADPCCQ